MNKNEQIARLIEVFYQIESNKSELKRYKDSSLNDKLRIIQGKLNNEKTVSFETLLSDYRDRTNELIDTFEKIL